MSGMKHLTQEPGALLEFNNGSQATFRGKSSPSVSAGSPAPPGGLRPSPSSRNVGAIQLVIDDVASSLQADKCEH